MRVLTTSVSAWVAASIVALAGCSSSDAGSGAGGGTTTDAGARADASGGSNPADAGGPATPLPDIDAGDSGIAVPEDLAATVIGTYAERMVVVTSADLPILGKNVSTTTSYGVATIARDGAGLRVTEVGCHVDVASTANVTTTIPDAIAKSVPPTDNAFRLWKEAGVVRFARIGKAVVIGAKLTDAEAEALPTASTDARVWDQDGDGHPGVTVKIGGIAAGDIYVVQRQKSSFEGTIAADGSMSGPLVDHSDQSVIGASNPLLNSNVPTTGDDPAKNGVKLVKAKDGLDCATLIATLKQLFP